MLFGLVFTFGGVESNETYAQQSESPEQVELCSAEDGCAGAKGADIAAQVQKRGCSTVGSLLLLEEGGGGGLVYLERGLDQLNGKDRL